MGRKPRIGLLVTALLEDEWNKGGAHRPAAAKALSGMEKDLSGLGTIVCPGLVETLDHADRARKMFIEASVDLILVMQLSYTQGVIPLRVLLETDRPVLVWNSQLIDSIPPQADWGTILVNSGVTGIPELTSALLRAGRRFSFTSGAFNDPKCRRELESHAAAAAVRADTRRLRIAIIGHPYKWMTDLMVDQFGVLEQLGVSIDYIEEGDVAAKCQKKLAGAEPDAFIRSLASSASVEGLTDELLRVSAAYTLAVKEAVKEHGVDGVAFYEQGLLLNPAAGMTGALGMCSLFSDGIPCASEADILTLILMCMMQRIAGASTFLEHYGMDFTDNTLLFAHDSFGNWDLADPGSVRILPTIFYEGTRGLGAAVRFTYKQGLVTCASLFPAPKGSARPFRMIAAEGSAEKCAPRPIPAPQMTFRPAGSDVNDFYRQWCMLGGPHHLAGCYGQHLDTLQTLADLMGIDFQPIKPSSHGKRGMVSA
jgi:L-arabinose isomerase